MKIRSKKRAKVFQDKSAERFMSTSARIFPTNNAILRTRINVGMNGNVKLNTKQSVFKSRVMELRRNSANKSLTKNAKTLKNVRKNPSKTVQQNTKTNVRRFQKKNVLR